MQTLPNSNIMCIDGVECMLENKITDHMHRTCNQCNDGMQMQYECMRNSPITYVSILCQWQSQQKIYSERLQGNHAIFLNHFWNWHPRWCPQAGKQGKTISSFMIPSTMAIVDTVELLLAGLSIDGHPPNRHHIMIAIMKVSVMWPHHTQSTPWLCAHMGNPASCRVVPWLIQNSECLSPLLQQFSIFMIV